MPEEVDSRLRSAFDGGGETVGASLTRKTGAIEGSVAGACDGAAPAVSSASNSGTAAMGFQSVIPSAQT